MTDPRMTPTNDAPVTVEQIAARLIDQSDEPDWTGGNYSERMNYWRDKAIDCSNRLAALASAPAVDAFADAGKPIAPAGDGVPSTAEVAEAIRIAREQADKVYGVRWMALEEISRHELVAAALARPPAAVGEREA